MRNLIIPFVFSILFSLNSHASAELHMKFHMGIGVNNKYLIGGSLENKGDKSIEKGFLAYTTSKKRCIPGEIKIFLFGSIAPNEKLEFKIPVEDKLDNYKILSFGGLDSFGIPVKTVDKTHEIIQKKMSDETVKCLANEFKK